MKPPGAARGSYPMQSLPYAIIECVLYKCFFPMPKQSLPYAIIECVLYKCFFPMQSLPYAIISEVSGRSDLNTCREHIL